MESLPHPSAESHIVPLRWPVISSRCLKRSCTLIDRALTVQTVTPKGKKHGERGNRWSADGQIPGDVAVPYLMVDDLSGLRCLSDKVRGFSRSNLRALYPTCAFQILRVVEAEGDDQTPRGLPE
jgi:hypothetical protein